ncbi:MAG: ATP-binding protein [Polyangiales bacterium]
MIERAGDAAPAEARTGRTRGILWWILGRMGVAAGLLGGTLLFSLDPERGYRSATATTLIGLILASFGSSLAATLLLARSSRPEHQITTGLLALDLVVVSALVYVTGGAGSVFTILYGATILMAAMWAGPRAARFTAVAATTGYVVIGVGLSLGLLPFPKDQNPAQYHLNAGDLAYALSTNVIGLVVVSLLGENLSNRLRQTGGELERATRSALELSRLNDDIVRSIASGLVTTDAEGLVRTINPAASDMLGLPTESLVGRFLGSLLPDVVIGAVGAGGPGIVRAEGRARRSDGNTFPIGYTLCPLRDEAGQPTGTLVAFQDLTEIKRLEARAKQGEQLAALGRLSAGMAHEIRNPLSSISGAVELVRENTALPPEDRRLLGIVLTEVERLNDLVTTMLNVARPRKPRPVPMDLAALVRDVATVAGPGMLGSSGVRVEIVAQHDPLPCVADPDQLRQVVWNLLKNAVQASPSGTKIVLASGKVGEDSVFFEVRDEGVGIDEEITGRLFDMFYSGRTHGVGIGLALVKQLVESHGGRVSAINAEPHGAVFRVEIPREVRESVLDLDDAS